jgi:hypothetical protein
MLLSISQLQQCLTVGFTFTLGNFLIVYHNTADTYFKFSAFFEVKKIWIFCESKVGLIFFLCHVPMVTIS